MALDDILDDWGVSKPFITQITPGAYSRSELVEHAYTCISQVNPFVEEYVKTQLRDELSDWLDVHATKQGNNYLISSQQRHQ